MIVRSLEFLLSESKGCFLPSSAIHYPRALVVIVKNTIKAIGTEVNIRPTVKRIMPAIIFLAANHRYPPIAIRLKPNRMLANGIKINRVGSMTSSCFLL